MNIKDLLLPVGLALVTVWGLQTFVFKSSPTKQDSFIAPRTATSAKPLNKEIDFVDAPRDEQEVRTAVQTEWGTVSFSTHGAVIDALHFKRQVGKAEQVIQTIHADHNRETGFMLLALDEKTPYFYTLAHREDAPDATTLTYEAKISECVVRKTYHVAHASNKIDLTLTVHPKGGATVTPRLVYQAPYMQELGEADEISAVIIDSNGKLTKTGRTSLEDNRGWMAPEIFGADNRYFLHALVGDKDGFVQRAYYRFDDNHKLSSFIEGPSIDKEHTWQIAFYVGPKEQDALVAVDQRLEKTLNYYGWFAPISYGMLKALNWLNDYLHNYGLAIIVLTLLMRLIMLPFTWGSEKNMKKQKEISKKLAYVKQRFKDDPQRLAQEQAEIMRKHGMPFLGGCLPLLLQIPFFFALSRLLSNSFELYQAPMLWISDLSASDPYYIFPLLVAGSMLLNALSADKQQQFSMIAMALVFGAITANLSAGLALYLVVNTILGIAQSKLVQAFS